MRSLTIVAICLGLLLAGLYLFDFLRHGASAAFHLLFLILLVPGATGFQFGIDLNKQFENGERDYYERIRGEAPEVVSARLMRGRRIYTAVLLLILCATELFLSTNLVGTLDPSRNPGPLFAAFAFFGVCILAVFLVAALGIWKRWVR